MMQQLDTEGRRFGEIGGRIARPCAYCGDIMFVMPHSPRKYCHPNCRYRGEHSGVKVRETGKREPKKQVWPAEYNERWDRVMGTAAGWERFRQFMRRNEGR